MTLARTFLRTRVARRIFGLFVACALLPVGALAVYSYVHVTGQLNDQSRQRVRPASKNTAMTLLEHLQLAEGALASVAATLASRSHATAPGSLDGAPSGLSDRFKGLAITSAAGAMTWLHGRMPAPPPLTAPQAQHLRSGGSVLVTEASSAAEPAILMGRAINPKDLGRGMLWSELDPDRVWRASGNQDVLPPGTEMCVFDQFLRPLYCSVPLAAAVLEGLKPALTSAPAGEFEWRDRREQETYVAGYWSLPLQFAYVAHYWTVVLSESKTSVLAPMVNFKRTFPLTILLALLVVLLLSNVQIRRSLDPLEKLQDGTRRIARREFATPVKVASGDEFEDLATSFNAMARRLERQFHALTAINEIDRAVLSALDTDRIIDTLLSRAGDLLACDGVSVSLARADGAWTLVGLVTAEGRKAVQETRPTPQERRELQNHPDHLEIDAREGSRSYLELVPFSAAGVRSFLALPIFLNQELSGVIALGYRDTPVFGEEDLVQARQLADQVAVALSNARLVEELAQLNWGTLTALARTIDAKSPWTAGHSERVTQLALAIGRQLGLTSKQLDHLQRGGLLHDIGKLGVPPAILDKPGPLTAEETRTMREHVHVGARILAPIAAYSEVIPIVLYHHERIDGTGYPNGLAGEAIPLLARVFAVADCFDALTADRPYRPSVPRPEAIEFIRQGSGTKFDPNVVAAFLAVTAVEEPASQQRTVPGSPAVPA